MKISEIFNTSDRAILSFEVFPPKQWDKIEGTKAVVKEMVKSHPAFMSVTYGAAGTTSGFTTEIAREILDDGVTPLAHLTCLTSTRDKIHQVVAELQENGIENILALRGDRVEGVEPQKDFTYASDLCRYIASQGDFDIAGACYPEVHSEANDEVEDIHNLRKKVESGASHLISQLFFDNSVYYRFLERAKIAGVNVPIEAGIMPVTSKSQIERMVSMCGASLPAKFAKIMQKYDTRPEALRDAGIAYAVDQIVDLIAHGVDGIHLYTMNNPYVARKITEAVSSLL